MDMDTSGGGFLHLDDNRQSNPFGGDRGGSEGQQDRARNTVHCSVAQVCKGVVPGVGLVLFRQKVHAVILVGLVTKVNDQGQVKVNYWMEDETGGPLEIQLLRTDDAAVAMPTVSIMENSYIRVYGQVKFSSADSFEPQKPYVLGFKIEPIQNISEVITHGLKVYRDAMLLERISNRVQLHQQGSYNRQGATDPFHDPLPSHTNGNNMSSMSSATATVPGTRGLNQMQTLVLKHISQDQSGEGISFAQLKEAFKTSMNEAKLKETCEFLVNEGHAYNTTDDTHYKSTES